MDLYELLVAGAVLAAVVSVGVGVHELLHALCLLAAGVPFEVEWLHGGRGGRLGGGLFGTWASIRLGAVPPDLPAWQLRAASLSPLLLATPLVAVALGWLPDPFAGDDLHLQLAVVGLLACAIPSPADFSLCWHARAVIAGDGEDPGGREGPGGRGDRRE